MTQLETHAAVDTQAAQYRDETATPGGRVRSWTRQSLRDVVYSGAVLAWSVAGFTILVCGVAVTVSLLVFVVGAVVWIGFAYIARWTTWVDRGLAAWQRHDRVPAIYRRPATPGFIPLFKTLSSDPQTWRDLAWLAVTAVIGFAGGLVMVTAAGLSVSYLSMPLWYWAVADPQAEYGLTTFGHHTVDTMGEALTMTAIGFALIPLVLVLARSFAKAHAGLAVRLLGPAEHQVVSDEGSSHA